MSAHLSRLSNKESACNPADPGETGTEAKPEISDRTRKDFIGVGEDDAEWARDTEFPDETYVQISVQELDRD